MYQHRSTKKKDGGARPFVDLSRHEKVARGKQRDVYLLDAAEIDLKQKDGPVVLKVPRYGERDARKHPGKRLLHSMFPSSALRVITNEAKYLTKLVAANGDDVSTLPLPAFLGFVDTSGGPGVLWEAICNQDGTLAPTVRALAAQGKHSLFLEALNQFTKTCFEKNIVAADMHASNLSFLERDGQKRVILIDGFGDHRLVSIRSALQWYNRRGLSNRFEKVARQAALHFDQEKRVFSIQRCTG